MNERDKLMLQIRPEIKIDTTIQNEQEKFQSIILRPILKLQNDLLLKLFIEENKNMLEQNHKTEAELDVDVTKTLLRNLSLKKTLIDMVVALFTQVELAFYFNNKREINKRISDLMVKRIFDGMQKLKI